MRVATNRAGILLAIMRPGHIKRGNSYITTLCWMEITTFAPKKESFAEMHFKRGITISISLSCWFPVHKVKRKSKIAPQMFKE